MKRMQIALAALTIIASAWTTVEAASPVFVYRNRHMGEFNSWHAGYHSPSWGTPHAIVVPRRAHLQTQYGWGVTGTSMTPIYNEYQRPAGDIQGEMTYPTPAWPSHTDQFGGYYVRIRRH